MELKFKPTKVPQYEIVESAGINYPYRTGTKDSDTHYKVTKNKVTFRVKKEEYIESVDGKRIIVGAYFLSIEYLKEVILKEEVKSFDDGFAKANIWAIENLNDIEYLSTLAWNVKEERHSKKIEDEDVNTIEKAKTIKFPDFSKYAGRYIFDIMQTDLEHCIAYYVGNLSSHDFDFSRIGVSQLNYNPSTERTKSYNCIKYLLDVLHPNISNNLENYFKDVNIEEMIFTSGKYKGKRILDIHEKNPNYIDWYLQSTSKTIYNIRTINALSAIKEQL